jgi:hypothetical protein
LGVAQWGAYNATSANFFLLPTRGWELLVGVFCAFYLKHNEYSKSQILNQSLSVLGLGMIIFSIIFFDEATPFPSLYALIPTIGTSLLILYAVPKTLIHKLLSLKFIVGIGLISYSAYLLHQPLLAFARYKLLGDISQLGLVFLCIASISLAWFSWKFVEAPFRSHKSFNRTSIYAFALVGIAIFSVIGLTLNYSNGLEQLKLRTYTNEERRNYQLVRQSTSYDDEDRMLVANCKLWGRDVSSILQRKFVDCTARYGSPIIVIGDSHAMNVYNIFARSNVFDFVVGLAQGGCRPHHPKPGCHYEDSMEFLTNIANLRPVVIYHQAASYFLTDEHGKYQPNTSGDLTYVESNVVEVDRYLKSLSALNLRVIWLGGFIEYGLNPQLNPMKIEKVPNHSFRAFNKLDEDVKETIRNSDVYEYVSFEDFFSVKADVVYGDCLIWSDADHFSTCGEELIAEQADWSALSLSH